MSRCILDNSSHCDRAAVNRITVHTAQLCRFYAKLKLSRRKPLLRIEYAKGIAELPASRPQDQDMNPLQRLRSATYIQHGNEKSQRRRPPSDIKWFFSANSVTRRTRVGYNNVRTTHTAYLWSGGVKHEIHCDEDDEGVKRTSSKKIEALHNLQTAGTRSCQETHEHKERYVPSLKVICLFYVKWRYWNLGKPGDSHGPKNTSPRQLHQIESLSGAGREQLN